MTIIRDATNSDETAWRGLWAQYVSFYEAIVPEEITAATWRRALDSTSPIIARLAERDRRVIGFALCVLHSGTWVVTPICHLEDLFVDPDARGLGVGQELIADLLKLGAERGWSRIYWHTRSSNTARKLYERFAPADDFVRYQLALPQANPLSAKIGF